MLQLICKDGLNNFSHVYGQVSLQCDFATLSIEKQSLFSIPLHLIWSCTCFIKLNVVEVTRGFLSFSYMRPCSFCSLHSCCPETVIQKASAGFLAEKRLCGGLRERERERQVKTKTKTKNHQSLK